MIKPRPPDAEYIECHFTTGCNVTGQDLPLMLLAVPSNVPSLNVTVYTE